VLVEAATIGVLAGFLAQRHSSTPASATAASFSASSGITATSSISPTSGQTVFSSTFRPADDWQTGQVTAHATARLSAAGYVVTGWGNYDHDLTPPLDGAHLALSVTVTSKLPPSQDSAGPECLSGAGARPDLYELNVGADGTWFAAARLGNVSWSGPPEILGSGSARKLRAPTVVELVCASISQTKGVTATRLVGFIDGRKVLEMTSSSTGVAASGWQPGLDFSTGNNRGSVTFTRYVVRSLG
jgi:hypothetical protein